MHGILFFVVILFTLLSHNIASSEDLKTIDEVKAFSETVMQSVVANDLKAAFDKTIPHTPSPQTEIEAVYLQLKTQREKIGNHFGKTTGYEFISSKKLGTSLLRLQYIEKMSKSALSWTFVFYNSGSRWSLIHFCCESNAHILFNIQ